ncbi:MAG: hypothetical protein JSU74_06915 [Candidatus Zixiibacteriota bacterium]|nr:MAG: hypothetical protein JSU74_06915 [candidate division Zixibacteria bacterium]
MTDHSENINMPFAVKDCALITRMGGVDTAVNLRELRERIRVCPEACLFHHFMETLVRPSFDDPEFRNDFAVWSARYLRDRVLAERLGILNPYKFDNLQQLRETVVETIDDRLAELPYVPSVPKGDDFIFMQAATVVFDVGILLESPYQLSETIPQMSYSSIYYHFIEARRRTEERVDDFTAWCKGVEEGCEELVEAFKGIEFYYMTLPELKTTLIETIEPLTVKAKHER